MDFQAFVTLLALTSAAVRDPMAVELHEQTERARNAGWPEEAPMGVCRLGREETPQEQLQAAKRSILSLDAGLTWMTRRVSVYGMERARTGRARAYTDPDER